MTLGPTAIFARIPSWFPLELCPMTSIYEHISRLDTVVVMLGRMYVGMFGSGNGSG